MAQEIGHYPDVDLRPEGVTVRTFSRQDGALSESDIALARRISDMARQLGLEPDPSQVQMVGIAVAQDAEADVRPFWSAALGYEHLGAEDAIDRHRRNPHLMFQALESPKAGRGRFHIDVSVPADQAEARVAAALGGRRPNRRRLARARMVDACFPSEPRRRYRGMARFRELRRRLTLRRAYFRLRPETAIRHR